MKNYYVKFSGFSLISALILSSCMTEVEMPQAQVTVAESKIILEAPVTQDENLRKSAEAIVYMEKFSNQSIQDPGKPYAFPGFGTGNATHLGKAYSFFNQYALGAPDEKGVVYTVAAPVSEFFGDQIANLGIEVDLLAASSKTVSTITTDGKGNSIWFHNVSTKATFDQLGNITFEADLEIVGGTGKFAAAIGHGSVTGNVQATDGKGTTLVTAQVYFK